MPSPSCVYAPMNNTARHESYENINLWVCFCFLYDYGAPLVDPSGRRSSAINVADAIGI